jgi:hypothetical protein
MVPWWTLIVAALYGGILGSMATHVAALSREIALGKKYLAGLEMARGVVEEYRRLLEESEAKHGKQ